MTNSDYPLQAGKGAIGARLRRLSERIDREAGRCYGQFGTRFEQRWFGILNQLTIHGQISVGSLAGILGISHVSVSQARKSLENEGYVASAPDPEDARKSVLSLTPAGKQLTRQFAPLWAAMEEASRELCEEADGLLEALGQLEQALDEESLTDRVNRHLAGQTAEGHEAG
ncbi:MarR family winged helix-turn-helix transcriptional regulator [Aurantiacibacter gilvus]|uniref:MarR family winged helix-turn-helix transcriptional regulator n=1 Tax=Aurantiacibacter gilvus TaxID=3139141 RepID=A0ABU9IIR4_9SPHN